MRADILIVGQGLAGTWLAWECERAGISFAVVDPGHESAASRWAAGIVNPITGRRFVKSWRIDALLPAARVAYRELERVLGVRVWQEMRIRRLLGDERERRVAREKQERGELAPYVVALPDDSGFWIEGAARVDVPALLEAARARWIRMGCLRMGAKGELSGAAEEPHLVVDCRGIAGTRERSFGFVPWEFSKGQLLTLKVAALDPDVVLNGGHWILPIAAGKAWIGATHEPEFTDLAPTAVARGALEASAAALLRRPFAVTGHYAGVRVNLPDKRPVAGRHPDQPRIGVANGLGAKGVLWAPMLARQWVNHLTEGVPFDAEISVGRFWRP